ncbi:MAG: substrate-binding domain-containing protein [Prolixibacteraceae bacterium]|nr:substrate-binding domain-containing protein [Prolixibacteraceae bacterium]
MKSLIKYQIYFLTFIALSFTTHSCTIKKSNKVGLLIHEMEGRWYNDVEQIKENAQELGLDLIIKDAQGNENLQISQAKELVEEDVETVIVVAVNQNTAAGIVRIFNKKNIPVIAYDRLISNSVLEYYISYEYTQIGRMQAEYALSKKPKGNYVLLWGDASDNNARLMRIGHEDVLKDPVNAGRVNVVHKTFIEGWSSENAKHKMKKILSFSDKTIDVVIASNDNIAQAVLEAFDELDMKYPQVVTGQDCTEQACRSIYQNRQTMTIYKPTEQMAKTAVSLANDLRLNQQSFEADGYVNNKRMEVPALFLTPEIIDKSNLNKIDDTNVFVN